MADRFDIVAVGIEDERAIVIRMILRAQAGCTVVLAADGDGRAIKRLDGRAVLATIAI